MEIPMSLDVVHYLALVLEIVAIQHQRVTLIFQAIWIFTQPSS